MSATGTFIAVEIPVVTTLLGAALGWAWRRRVAVDDQFRADARKAIVKLDLHLVRSTEVEREFRTDIAELKQWRRPRGS